MSMPEAFKKRMQERQEKEASEKKARLEHYRKTKLRIMSSFACTMRNYALGMDVEPHFYYNGYGDKFDYEPRPYIVLLHNLHLTRVTQQATEYVIEYGPFPVCYTGNGKDLPIPYQPHFIAMRYGDSLISKVDRYFNAPYWGDYFDNYTVHTLESTTISDQVMESSDVIDQIMIQAEKKGHAIEIACRPPIGLDIIVNTGLQGELQCMIDYGLARKDKDFAPWRDPDYDPHYHKTHADLSIMHRYHRTDPISTVKMAK